MILETAPRQIIFLMIFLTGLGFMLTEAEIGEYSKIIPIAGMYVLPPFTLLSLILNRQLWPTSKKSYLIETLRDACICSLVVALFIPTINRLLPPSTDYKIDGQLIDVKPGKGGRTWGLIINDKTGKKIDISVPRSQFPNPSVGEHFELAVKRGGLGILYGPGNKP